MSRHSITLVIIVGAMLARPLVAQPAVRLLDMPDAATKHILASPVSVRQLSDGSLLVNDSERRQLIAFSRDLTGVRIVADSAGGLANSYGPRPGGLIPYVGDSTLFVDPVGLSMLVLAPDGSIARIASIPRSQDAAQLASGSSGVDGGGRIIYRGPLHLPTLGAIGVTTGGTPDSMDIDRLDLAARKLDTAGFFKTFQMTVAATQTEKGLSATAIINPIQTVDDWAVLSSGVVAIVRGLDYHVDLIDATGTITRGQKIPFPWRPLSDDDKARLLDSARARMTQPSRSNQTAGNSAIDPSAHGMTMSHAGMKMTMTLVPASELPDYFPAFEQNASQGDADGNLWIRTTATRPGAVGGPIYDVIGGRGVLVDRIQVPAGRRVLGFGRNGVVYLVARDASGAWIERSHRTRWRSPPPLTMKDLP